MKDDLTVIGYGLSAGTSFEARFRAKNKPPISQDDDQIRVVNGSNWWHDQFEGLA